MTLQRSVFLVTVAAAAVIGYLWLTAAAFSDLWLTPDQQGRVAYERKDYRSAAMLFTDPHWRGIARYADGQYLDAAEDFARVPQAVALFNRGNALLKGREYAQAIESFELAVEEAPDWEPARENLRLARHILDYLESTREQTGTGGKLEADEYRYDTTSDRGEEAVIRDASAIEAQSTEKWMRSVDTRTSEFLSLRFSLEAARRQAPAEDER